MAKMSGKQGYERLEAQLPKGKAPVGGRSSAATKAKPGFSVKKGAKGSRGK